MLLTLGKSLHPLRLEFFHQTRAMVPSVCLPSTWLGEEGHEVTIFDPSTLGVPRHGECSTLPRADGSFLDSRTHNAQQGIRGLDPHSSHSPRGLVSEHR